MKKRLIALLLAAAILLSTAPAAAADSSLALQSMQSGRCGSSAAWTLNLDTGTLRIFGFGAMDDFESYQTEVPWYAYRNSIQTVAVGIGITSIGYSAFRDCANLTRVSISNTVKRIESCAFMGCTSLTEIVLPGIPERPPTRKTPQAASLRGFCCNRFQKSYRKITMEGYQ